WLCHQGRPHKHDGLPHGLADSSVTSFQTDYGLIQMLVASGAPAGFDGEYPDRGPTGISPVAGSIDMPTRASETPAPAMPAGTRTSMRKTKSLSAATFTNSAERFPICTTT